MYIYNEKFGELLSLVLIPPLRRLWKGNSPMINRQSTFRTAHTTAARSMKRDMPYFIMVLPAVILMLAFNYLPMAGVMISFKRMKFFSSNIFINFAQSQWVGFENFKYFFKTPDAFNVIRNTVCYNLTFIILGTIVAVILSIALNEVTNKRLGKFYQTSMILPYFLSWVVVSYLVYSFLSPSSGLVNRYILERIGKEGIDWYTNTSAWPFILVFLNLWKYTGYNCVVYLASLTTIDSELFEAANIDGASKLHQIRYITLPHLYPLMTILSILALGRIIQGDFGLFYFATSQLGNGALKPVGDVMDTYVYDTLMNTGDLGMSAAASLFQSIVGFALVLGSNLVVKRFNSENSLF